MIRSSRIHTLSALAFAMILPVAAHATEGTAKSSSAPATHAMNATATTTAHPAHMAAKTKRAPAVDINSASKEDLMKLSGITDELAEKIIASRPYKTKMELTKKQILTKVEYAKVRAHVIAKQEKPETKAMEAKEMKEGKEAPETKTPDSK